MPTYEYECKQCKVRFQRRQPITEAPLVECPECGGEIYRLISGGAGFILRGNGPRPGKQGGGNCRLEQKGRTCCGREERCSRPPCEDG
jgi:putative FmdB family regulatory protein